MPYIDGGTCPYTPHCVMHSGVRRVPQASRGTLGPSYTTVLNAYDVQLVRAMYDNGIPRKQIARKFSISYATVQDIGKRRTWKWVS